MRALIEREIAHAKAGRPARLIFKNNAVTDTGMIRALYAASQAGVPIDLITRGVCCLRPGVPGVSATINVRSVVGRFLEHSRIYYFENGGEPEAFIGSADLMERNLDRRVEVLCPVRDPDIRHHLRHVVLDALLRETDRATRLLPDGEYVRCAPAPGDAPSARRRCSSTTPRTSSDASQDCHDRSHDRPAAGARPSETGAARRARERAESDGRVAGGGVGPTAARAAGRSPSA